MRDGRDPARRLADALDRDLVLVDGPGGLASVLDGSVRSVLLSGGETVTTADLVRLAGVCVSAGVWLGFLHGWAGEQVAAAHADKIAGSLPSFAESTLVWSDFPGLPSHRGGQPPTTVLPPGDETVPAELVAGHRLVCIETHGNGVDAPLGPGRQLCARVAVPDQVPRRASLPCLHGGPCIRAPGGVAAPDRLLSPADIRADVLVWSTCWGLLAADSTFDAATSVARHLVVGSPVAAVLTTVTSVRASPARLLSIAAMLAEGDTVGSLAMTLNRAEDTTPWVVLGDPAARAFPPGPGTDAVRPGVFRLAEPDAPVPVSVRAGKPVFLTNWPDLGGYAGIQRGPKPVELSVSPVDPGAGDAAALLALWRPRPALAFVAGLMRWARASTYLDTVPDSTALEHDVELAAARQEQLAAHPRPHTLLSGPPTRIARLLDRERRSWRELHIRIADYLHEYATTSAGVFTHVYQRYGRSSSASWPHPCPYCGGESTVDEFHLPTAGATRAAVHCVACGNIADLGPSWGSVTLSGPDTLVPGRPAGYAVEARSREQHRASVALAQLAVQRVPFPVASAGEPVDMEPVDEYTLSATASLLPRAEAPRGRYFLLALLVVDGEVVMGRRPVTIWPTEEVDC